MEDALKVNVRERAYKLDPRPISLGCECYTCTHHSIGYIHHLLSTHEMLASVLLNMYPPPTQPTTSHPIPSLIS
jgi:tRNA-guanine family transglycosylase